LLLVLAFSYGAFVFAQDPTSPATNQGVADSREWQDARRELHEWLSVQKLYSEQEIEQMLNDLRLRVAGMNEKERAEFLREMQGRLAVLNSDQAQQARAWVGETMSRLTPAARQQFKAQLPDVANMTESQMRQYLSKMQMRQAARQRDRAATAELRSQQNQMIVQMNQERQTAFEDARRRQQSAVATQATNRVQQGFQQSLENATRDRNFYAPGAWDYHSNPYRWLSPWW
jgi:hypothetical protein